MTHSPSPLKRHVLSALSPSSSSLCLPLSFADWLSPPGSNTQQVTLKKRLIYFLLPSPPSILFLIPLFPCCMFVFCLTPPSVTGWDCTDSGQAQGLKCFYFLIDMHYWVLIYVSSSYCGWEPLHREPSFHSFPSIRLRHCNHSVSPWEEPSVKALPYDCGLQWNAFWSFYLIILLKPIITFSSPPTSLAHFHMSNFSAWT